MKQTDDTILENISHASTRSYQPPADQQPVYRLNAPVFFVGFMGAGKTTVARRVARLTRQACVDLDAYLERREGKTCAQIFAESGEDGFRDLESGVLRQLISGFLLRFGVI